jgi:SAM-dependent methyltransferase
VRARVEQVACPLCRASEASPLFDAVDRLHGTLGTFRYVRCGECGLGYQAPQVLEEDLHLLYPPDRYAPHRPPQTRAGRRRGPSGLMRFVRETLALENVGDRVAAALPASARWLDVGCGSGAYLLRLRERFGLETYGVDFSPAAAATARSAGLKVHQGSIHEAPFPDGSFDAVSAWWFLEHVPDPSPTLERMAALLRPGGTMLLAVPNLASLNARLFRTRWYHLDCPRHLTLWTPATLARLHAQAGLHVERAFYDRATWGLAGSLRYSFRPSGRADPGSRLGVVACQALLPWTLATGLTRVADTVAVKSYKPHAGSGSRQNEHGRMDSTS